MDLLRNYFEEELKSARACRDRGDVSGAWSVLERAHVLSKSHVTLHLRAHCTMLHLAWTTRDSREIRGQLFRLLIAGPGSALGRAPLGNSGRASVNAFAPMPIPTTLREKLIAAGVEVPRVGDGVQAS